MLFHLNRNASLPSKFFKFIFDICRNDRSLYFLNGEFHNILIMLASEAVKSQSCAVKRISSNTHVLGTFGPLIDDVKNRGHRKRARIFGTVLHALDKGMYKVQFDDGSCQDVYANRLCVKS